MKGACPSEGSPGHDLVYVSTTSEHVSDAMAHAPGITDTSVCHWVSGQVCQKLEAALGCECLAVLLLNIPTSRRYLPSTKILQHSSKKTSWQDLDHASNANTVMSSLQVCKHIRHGFGSCKM